MIYSIHQVVYITSNHDAISEFKLGSQCTRLTVTSIIPQSNEYQLSRLIKNLTVNFPKINELSI